MLLQLRYQCLQGVAILPTAPITHIHEVAVEFRKSDVF